MCAASRSRATERSGIGSLFFFFFIIFFISSFQKKMKKKKKGGTPLQTH